MAEGASSGGKKVILTAELKESISESLKSIKEGFAGMAEAGSQANQKLASAMRGGTQAVEDHAVAVEKASKEHVSFRGMLGQTKESVGSLAGGLVSLTGSLLKVGTGFMAFLGAAQIVGDLKDAFQECLEQGKDAEQVEAKLNVTLADTGKITGVTKEQLDNLTDSLMLHTTYSDDTIKSAEGVMAAFTNISSKVFPAAMQASTDLAAKMGLDLPNAARLIGRALDNPTTGMLTMTRYGITLTQAMKDQIKTFLAHGETAKAQGVILDALKTKFGGVADAIGNTLQGKMTIFQNQLDNVKEGIGLALIPVLSRLLDASKPVLDFMAHALPNAFNIVADFGTQVVLPFFQRVQDALANLQPYAVFAGNAFLHILQPAFMSIVNGLKTLFLPIWSIFQDTVGHFSADKSAQSVKRMGSEIIHFGTSVGQVLAPILGLVGAILRLAGVLINDALRGFVNLLGPMTTVGGQSQSIGKVIKDTFVNILSTAVSWIQKFTDFLASNTPAAIAVKLVIAAIAAALLATFAPVQAVIAGIALLTAAFLHFFNTNVGFHDFIVNLASLLGGAFHMALQAVGAVLGVVGTVLGFVFGKLGDLLSVVGPKILPALGDLHNHFADISSGLQNLFMPAINTMVTALKVALPIAIGIVLLVLQNFQKTWDTLWPFLSVVLGTVINNVKIVLGTLFGFLGNLMTLIGDLLHGRWGNIGKDVLKIIGDLVGGVLAWFGNIKDGVLGIMAQLWKDVGGGVTKFLSTLLADLGAAVKFLLAPWIALWNGVKAVMGPPISWVLSTVGNLIGFFVSVFTTIGKIIVALTVDAWNAIMNAINPVLNWVSSHVQASLNFWKNVFAVVWGAITKALSDTWNTIKTVIQNALSSITTWLSNQWHTIQNTVSSVWNGITSTIGNAWTNIRNAISSKATDTKNAVLSPFQQAAAAIGGIMGGFAKGMVGMLNAGIGTGGSIIDWLGQRLDDIASKLIGSRPIAHFAFTPIKIPGLYKGTDSFAGGLAIVGEEGPELVSLPKGSKVMPAKETAAVLQGRVPQFAGGIGDILGDIGNFFSARINDLKSAAAAAMGKLIQNVPFLNDLKKLGGVYGSLGGGAVKNLQSWGFTALQHWLSNFGGGASGVVAGGHMTGTLPGYLLMNQLALTDRNKDNDCVPTSLASAVSYDLHRVVSPVSLKDAVYGASYMGGQSPGRYAAYVRRLGINLGSISGGSGTLVSYIHRYLSAGIPVLASIPSDWNNAAAQGSTHEIAFAGQSAGRLIAMNPWRGFWQAAPDNWWMPRLRYNTINPVQKMARGGVISEPVFGVGASGMGYLLGEAGPETVTPGRGVGGGSPIHVHVYLNGKELTNNIGSDIVHHIRTRTGRKL